MNIHYAIIAMGFAGALFDLFFNIVYADDRKLGPNIEREILATVEAERRQQLRIEIGGRVISSRLTMGQQVREGELLVALDDREANALHDQAVAEYQRIEAQRTYQQALLVRAEKNLSRGVIANVEYERIQSEVNTLNAQLTYAKAALSIARLTLDKHQLAAPFSGVLMAAGPLPGDFLQVNQVAVELVDVASLKLSLSVTAAEIKQLVAGDVAISDVSTGQTLDLHAIAPAADAMSGLTRIEVMAPQALRLMPGQAHHLVLRSDIDANTQQLVGRK